MVNLGRYGENLARMFFERLGFELVEENFRFERAETDLIFKDDSKKLLLFVEVKTRRNKTFGEPEESVTEHKMKQMLKSAQGFLMMYPEYEEYDKRFDVAAIMIEGGKEKINHIENVF
jgi:putative endonuclease